MPTFARWGALAAAVAFASPAFAAEYDLVLEPATSTLGGAPGPAITVNGAIPGPTLRFREGETAVVRVTNKLDEPSSVHWHGILLDAAEDGVPGFNGFSGIAPGQTYAYRFTIRQAGAYWYHAHSATQEQAGHYGAIVIDPPSGPATQADRDYVLVFSEATSQDPERILANLKVDPGHYNRARRTAGDFLRDARKFGFAAAWRDRAAWGRMRMDPTDMSDVGGYVLLANGKSPAANETMLFEPGEKVRLRLVNASAMTYLDVRIPGLKMTVVAADGRDVEPVAVDELRLAAAETYDVIVEPTGDRAFTVFAESIDRSGYARATLATRAGETAPVPAMRPRAILTMAEMGHAVGHGSAPAAATQDPHAGHATQAADAHSAHAGHAAPGALPVVDYGMGRAQPAHGGVELGPEGSLDGSGRPFGWSSGAPAGSRVLSYDDLKARSPLVAAPAPDREIVVRLGGDMERFVWTLNGKTFAESEPIRLRQGETVRMVFVNESMMAHPMHLHGMFMRLENGQPLDRLPDKHVVSVAPGRTASVLVTADAPGQWAFHCHLLYHMEAGMMQQVLVEPSANAPAPAAPAPAHDGHAGRAGH